MVTGCYRYQVVAPDTLSPGTEVRARLSADAVERAAEVLASGDDIQRVIEGRFVERERESVVLLVPFTRTDPGGARLGQRLRFDLRDILEIESKHLDRRRTALVLGTGAVILGVAVIRQLRDSGEGLGPNPPGGGPEELVVPAGFRIRFSF
jgi:hypothetical protein